MDKTPSNATTDAFNALAPFRAQFVAAAEQALAAQDKWLEHQRAQAKAAYAFADTSTDVASRYAQSAAKSWLAALA